jgi:hypothetical protein
MSMVSWSRDNSSGGDDHSARIGVVGMRNPTSTSFALLRVDRVYQAPRRARYCIEFGSMRCDSADLKCRREYAVRQQGYRIASPSNSIPLLMDNALLAITVIRPHRTNIVSDFLVDPSIHLNIVRSKRL